MHKDTVVKITQGYYLQNFTSSGDFIEQSFVESNSNYENLNGEPLKDCDLSHPFNPPSQNESLGLLQEGFSDDKLSILKDVLNAVPAETLAEIFKKHLIKSF